MNKEVRQFCRKLKNKGWSWCYTNGGHVKLTHPAGEFFITSSTPSDGMRWRQNVEREARVIEERAVAAAWMPLSEIEVEEHDTEFLLKKFEAKFAGMVEDGVMGLIHRYKVWI